MLKCGLGYSLTETMQSPSIASPRPLNDLGELEVCSGDLKTNISEQSLIAIPATTEDIAPSVNTQVDPSFPLRDVNREEAFTANSISDGVSLVSQECKLKNFSPLAREVAARIKVLLHAKTSPLHRDEALSWQASSRVDCISPRLQDSSLNTNKSILKKPYFRQLVQYNP
ncbi:hypothetical protein Nepgr_008011 [Nepenthes gracilis]|uniref:Uncharacterized protein n=1 Tax=Nepenthes gracilis TaxID=150966 RepID=A0AAD3S8T9_NEPGR|nr:hypothetical protein Nepgr_008011 [Nepenthes gracilis]